MVVEVFVRIIAVGATVWAAVPAVRSAVAAPTFGGTAPAGRPFPRTSAAQAGQRLGDGFGGIRRGGVTGFGGHASILHAT